MKKKRKKVLKPIKSINFYFPDFLQLHGWVFSVQIWKIPDF